MCLIFIAVQQHPEYKLIVAANRDEFYERKTSAATFWSDHPAVLGGRDLEAGGTWMGMNTDGRISMLTNFRDPAHINPKAPSRGHLVSDFLIDPSTPLAYMSLVEKKAEAYNGFNLVLGTPEELYYFSNYREGIDRLNAGLYGLSNALLDTPWPKVVRGKQKLAPLLTKTDIRTSDLFELLYDDRRADSDQLPNTGIGLDRESALSSMFIKTNNYGSRCSTVVLVDQQNHVQFVERQYDLKTFDYTTREYSFTYSS